MARHKLEQETTLTVNEAEGQVLVYSASPHFQRKLRQRGIEPYKQAYGTHHSEDDKSCWYRIPKAGIRVSPPREVAFCPRRQGEKGTPVCGGRLRERINFFFCEEGLPHLQTNWHEKTLESPYAMGNGSKNKYGNISLQRYLDLLGKPITKEVGKLTTGCNIHRRT